MSEGKNTIRVVSLVIGLTVASKLFGFMRDVLIGSRFGTSIEADAYFMALKTTAFIFMSIGSAITTTMIPIVVDYITKDKKEKAFRFANKIFSILFLFCMIVIPLGILLAPYYIKYIAFGFDGKQLGLTILLTRTMFPILLCTFLTYIFVSLLQAQGKFSITSILSVPYNIILIIYLIGFAHKYGIKGLAVVTVMGWIAQFAIQLPYLYKKGYRVGLIIDFKDKDVTTFFKLVIPTLLSTMVYNVNTIVDSSLASSLSEGKLSALTYGFIIYTAISSTTIYGISTVIFPKFSQSSSMKDYETFKKSISNTIRVLIFLLIPMTIGLITLRTPIVRLAYERGAFDFQGVIYTRTALAFYSIGMIGFGVQDILNKSFYALKDTKTPMKYGIISIIINIVLNIILVRSLDLAGLALATAIASISNGIFLYIALTNKIGSLDTKKIMITLMKVLIAAGTMSYITYSTYSILGQYIGMGTFIEKGITLIGSVSTGIIIYGAVTILFKVEEANYLVKNYIKKISIKK